LKTQFVEDLQEGGRVDSIFALSGKKRPLKKNGDPFLVVELGDRTGKVEAKRWECNDTDWDTLQKTDFARIAGKVEEFGGRLQVIIERWKPVSTPEELGDFVETAAAPIDLLSKNLDDTIAQVKNPYLNALLKSVFEDPSIRPRFETAPAAKGMHHAVLHGLIQHTLEVTDLARATVDAQAQWGYDCYVSRDLVIAGALIHDIGKIDELSYDGLEFGYTLDGNLMGHIVMGAQLLSDKMSKIPNFPKELRASLIHIVLAHHGKGDHGSPIPPMLAEAQIVHMADLMDVQLYYLRNACADAKKSGESVVFLNSLDGIPKMSPRKVYTGSLGASIDDGTDTE
jgi:3'-5' exoribonuclease